MVISFFHFVDVIARLVVVKRGFTCFSNQRNVYFRDNRKWKPFYGLNRAIMLLQYDVEVYKKVRNFEQLILN